MELLILILSLPTENATIRMRVWRTLKASGAAVLRDGVYLMPERISCRNLLNAVCTEVRFNGGNAYVMGVEEPDDVNFSALFDRSADYAALQTAAEQIRNNLNTESAASLLKQTRKLRKRFASLVDIDFYPADIQTQLAASLQELELSVVRLTAPDEPHPTNTDIASRLISEYQGRTWATRRRSWVDRLACAWLIRRYIDPRAQLLWLTSPADCPADALGFDFDGAAFSHVGNLVSFEVLLISFNLAQPGFRRLGALVHYLDIGGPAPSEASGVETILAGWRAAIDDDDQLLAVASNLFDGLLFAFQKTAATGCTD